MKMKKLTRAQQAAWEAIKYLVEQGKDRWHGFCRESNGIISAKDKWSPPYRTLRGLEVAGLIEIEPDVLFGNSKKFTLTPAGRAELAAEPASVGDGVEPEPEKRKQPFMGTRSNPCCKERDDLQAKLARAEAALDDIINLRDDSFQTAWSIAVAARRELAGEGE